MRRLLATALLLSMGGATWAHVALPEQRLTGPAILQGFPVLTARGSVVIGVWQGYHESPEIRLELGHSPDAGATWELLGGELALVPPQENVWIPNAVALDPLGSIHLTTNGGPVEYYRGAGRPTVTWTGPVFLFPLNSDGYFHQPSLGLGGEGAHAYVAATQMEFSYDLDTRSVLWFTRSLDAGATWSAPFSLSSPTTVGASMAVGPDGTIHVVFVDVAAGQVMLTRSFDQGASFQPPVPIAPIHDNLGMLPMGWGMDSQNRVYPYYLFKDLAPNFPVIAVDRSGGPHHGSLYVTWAEHAEGTVSPAERFLGETADNNTFESAQPVPINSDVSGSYPDIHFGGDIDYFRLDAVAGQHIWISGQSVPTGIPFYLWRTHPDGRRLLTDVGFLTNPNAFPYEPRVPIPMILTPTTTGPIYFHLQTLGPYSASYTLRLRTFTPSPSSASRDMRDIVLVRSTDGGTTWGPKVRVNHDPAGADQHQPNVAVDERGVVYVAWYDRRGFAFGDSVHAYASVSTDGGRSFGSDLRLSSVPTDWGGSVAGARFNGHLIGDRIAIAAGTDYAVVAWADMRNSPERSDIYASRIVDLPTATEAVSDLGAEPSAEGVRLRWLVHDWRAVTGLRVHRAEEDGIEAPLGEADLEPTRSGWLEHLDATAEPGREYRYRLQVKGATGVRWLGPVSVAVPARIPALACRAAGPNPFARTMCLRLAVPQAGAGAVRVYDVQGKAVRTLAEGTFEPGERTLEWDGRDSSGAPAAPGIYFVAAEVGGEHARLRVARVP